MSIKYMEIMKSILIYNSFGILKARTIPYQIKGYLNIKT